VIAVTNPLRFERFLVGLRGLGLLREWPFGDAAEADRALEAIADLSVRRGEPFDMDFDDVRGAYTDWAEVYDGPNPLIDVEEVALRSLLADVPPGRALDVACGTGRVTAILAELGHDVTAVDATPAMLARAEAKGIRATFLSGDMERLPVGDGSFDVVTCALSLTHVVKLDAAIAEMARALEPGGTLVLTDIHPVAVATGAHAQLQRVDGSRSVTRNHVHWPSTYVDAATAAGLVVARCLEPPVDEAFFESLGPGDLRDAARHALDDLPYALLWRLRKV
jgi:ubiquinone/menaquinone biosynthesis C-methylase UbiE